MGQLFIWCFLLWIFNQWVAHNHPDHSGMKFILTILLCKSKFYIQFEWALIHFHFKISQWTLTYCIVPYPIRTPNISHLVCAPSYYPFCKVLFDTPNLMWPWMSFWMFQFFGSNRDWLTGIHKARVKISRKGIQCFLFINNTTPSTFLSFSSSPITSNMDVLMSAT